MHADPARDEPLAVSEAVGPAGRSSCWLAPHHPARRGPIRSVTVVKRGDRCLSNAVAGPATLEAELTASAGAALDTQLFRIWQLQGSGLLPGFSLPPGPAPGGIQSGR